MRTKSPLGNFTDILEQIRTSASIYNESLRTNESSTRAVLIDPVLRVLGWDISNPFMVEIEKPIDQGRVDYALFDSNQELRVIIEAKKLDFNLSEKEVFLSLVKYAFSSGISDIFLTDGLRWHHYTNFMPNKPEPTKVLSLESDNLVEIAGYLVQRLDSARYWPEDKDVDELSQRINQLDSEMNLLHLEISKLKSEKTLSGFVTTAKRPLDSTKFIRLDNTGNVTGKKPSKLRLPDGTEVNVKTWTDVLTQCCKYAMDNVSTLPVPLKDAADKKVSLVSESQPPLGIAYYETEYQGKKVFVYTNYDANNCIRNSIHILKFVNNKHKTVDPAISLGLK